MTRLVAAAAALVLCSGCIILPVIPTDRAERVPPVTAPGFKLAPDERRLWRDAEELEARARKSGAVLEDPPLERYLVGVARRLAPRGALDHLDVRVRVIESPALTAFVAPNGAVFVSMGMLARLENEAQLAMVLGHELTHAVNRHSLVEYRTVKGGLDSTAGLPFGLGALGTKAAVTGYSRDLEREADVEGLALLAAGGWDVREAPRPFEHLAEWVKEEKIEEPYTFATHPRLEERLESTRALVKERYAGRSGGDVGGERYRQAVREVVLATARLDLAAGRFGPAERGAEAYLALRPRSAEGLTVLADAARQQGQEPRALELYRKAVATDAGCAEAQRGLGLALSRRGERAGARTALRTYLKLAPAAVDRAWIEGELADLDRRTP
ncbi:MAG TPA: M48 family metalloprotease [Anaeromyxobacteraceae bacterium]|nr:M48 family metalloprotease [Anaeromyxobacteraceae bacterium]